MFCRLVAVELKKKVIWPDHSFPKVGVCSSNETLYLTIYNSLTCMACFVGVVLHLVLSCCTAYCVRNSTSIKQVSVVVNYNFQSRMVCKLEINRFGMAEDTFCFICARKLTMNT